MPRFFFINPYPRICSLTLEREEEGGDRGEEREREGGRERETERSVDHLSTPARDC